MIDRRARAKVTHSEFPICHRGHPPVSGCVPNQRVTFSYARCRRGPIPQGGFQTNPVRRHHGEVGESAEKVSTVARAGPAARSSRGIAMWRLFALWLGVTAVIVAMALSDFLFGNRDPTRLG